jgi:hypothetical protein
MFVLKHPYPLSSVVPTSFGQATDILVYYPIPPIVRSVDARNAEAQTR